MAGVVYGGGQSDTLGRFGDAIAVASGAVIPPGVYYVTGTWQIVTEDATYGPFGAGFCVSDGVQTKATAAINAIPLGARGETGADWPWKQPWPLT